MLVEAIDRALDAVVVDGSDDELFIASYLQGHFAVEARKLELDENASLADLCANMQASFQRAFRQKELESQDQQAVLNLWQRLIANEA